MKKKKKILNAVSMFVLLWVVAMIVGRWNNYVFMKYFIIRTAAGGTGYR